MVEQHKWLAAMTADPSDDTKNGTAALLHHMVEDKRFQCFVLPEAEKDSNEDFQK